MAVDVPITGDASSLLREQKKVEAGADSLKNEYKNLARESKNVENFAVRAFRNAQQPLEKYNKRLEELRRLLKRGKIDQTQFNAATREARIQLNAAGQAGRQAYGREALSNLKALAAGAFGLAAVWGTASRALATYVQNLEEAQEATNNLAQDSIAFVSIQEAGTAGVRARAAIQAGAGVATPGESLNIVQGLQSAVGSFEEGLSLFASITDAARVGIDVNTANRLVTQAIGQNLDPVTLLRSAFIAGEASASNPQVIARAAEGLQAFDDSSFGFAVIAQLAPVFAEAAGTFARQAGVALSDISPLAPLFSELDLPSNATRQQRLEALSDNGILTIEDLAFLGLTESRQQRALAPLLQNLDNVNRIAREVEGNVSQPVLKRGRTELLAQPGIGPQIGLADEIARTRAETEVLQSFDADSQRIDLRTRNRAQVLRERGQEQFLVFDLITSEGSLTTAGRIFTGIAAGSRVRPSGTIEDELELRRNLGQGEGLVTELLEADQKTAEATERLLENATTPKPLVPVPEG